MLPDHDGRVDTWHEPARDIPVIGRPDVLVVGAGSAGVAAAIAAARGGADTWLIERSSSIGGLATVGLINLLLTLDDGAGHQVVAGLCQEFVDRMAALGRCRFPPESSGTAKTPISSRLARLGARVGRARIGALLGRVRPGRVRRRRDRRVARVGCAPADAHERSRASDSPTARSQRCSSSRRRGARQSCRGS